MTDATNDRDDEKDDNGGLIDRLREFYEVANIPIPEDAALTVPTCYVGLSSPEMAVRISGMLRGRDLLFTRDGKIGTIDEADGSWRLMTEGRFATWLTLTAGILFYSKYDKESGKPIQAELPGEKSRRVLMSDELRVKLSVIERINPIRMPVFRDELDERESTDRKGFKKLDLLPIGYDAQTKTFTTHGAVDFDEAMDCNEGYQYLHHLIKYFEFGDKRGIAVQMAAQMTVFCQSLFRGRSPMFVYNSNLPGSGKSTLAQLALEMVHGVCGRSGYHVHDLGEVRKELDATAQDLGRYQWFDDVSLPPGYKLRSSDLNRWLTGDVWSGRVMQTKEKFEIPLEAITFMTGAGIVLDDHIARRSLFVDLFSHQTSRDRVIPAEATMLDEQFFKDENVRAKVLGSLWALVRWWDDEGRASASGKPIASFENWSTIIPAIVEGSSFGDCLAPFVASDAGDTESAEFKILIKALIKVHCKDVKSAVVTMKDIVTQARLEGLFVEKLLPLDQIVDELESRKSYEFDSIWVKTGEAPPQLRIEDMTNSQLMEWALERDPSPADKRKQAAGWTDRSIMQKWSNVFIKSATTGQWFKDEDGQLWQFGDRKRNKAGARYRIFRVEAA